MENEIWKFIPDTNNTYMISEKGIVKSVDRMIGNRFYKGTILKSFVRGLYKTVDICMKGKVKKTQVHKIMGVCFLQNPNNLKCIDHIDRNKLNNDLSNLRFCTYSENSRNRDKFKNKSSKYIGVHYNKEKRKYKACIIINYKSIFLGYFNTEEMAADAYNKSLIENNVGDHSMNFIL